VQNLQPDSAVVEAAADASGERLEKGSTRAGGLGLRLHFAERKLFLALMDLAIINTTFLFHRAVRVSGGPGAPPDSLGKWITWFAVLSLIWLAVAMVIDLYDLELAADRVKSTVGVAGAALMAIACYTLVPLVTPGLPVRRLEVFSFPVLAALSLALWRLCYARVFVQPVFTHTALVVGAGAAGQALAEALSGHDRLDQESQGRSSYRLLGFLDEDPARQGMSVAGVPIVGLTQELRTAVARLRPDELVVALDRPHQLTPLLVRGLVECRQAGLQVTTVPILFENLFGRVPVAEGGATLSIVIPVRSRATMRLYLLVKRMLDLAAGLVGCGLVCLLAPFLWLANRWTSPGPLFFSQDRVGAFGKVFKVVKFRSMVVNAEEATGPVWAQEDDPRITLTGRLLRKTRLDELPQVWNVLKGEMSLVGPRPERPEFVEELAVKIPYYLARHAVKPGVTGWAQVKYRYAASVEDALRKLEYDLYYIKHQSFLLDLEVMLRTVQIVLRFKGK
jgi:exopolysaccharide biosynthesis polyprenyl glycosylphosphotransferase